MKKAVLAIAVTTSLFVLSACGNGSSEVIVKTNAGDVTKDDFYAAAKTAGGEAILKNLVLEKALLKKYPVTDKDIDAKLKEIKDQTGDQFPQFLQQMQLKDEASLKERIKSQLALQKAVEAGITDKELEEANSPQIRASHILVADEGKAKEVETKLAAGGKFEDLAKEYSSDGSKDKGGDLGFFGHGDMVKEFEEAAYKLKVGEVSAPVKSQFGYHIIKVTEKKDAKEFKDLTDDAKAALKQKLVQKKTQDGTVEKLIQKTYDDAEIKVEDKDFKDLFKAPEPAPTK